MSIRYLIFGLFCGDKFLGRIWRYVSISSFESFGYFLKTQNIFEREGETSLLPAYRGPRTRGCLLSLPPLLQLLKIRSSSKGAMGLCDESCIVPLPDLTRSGRRFPSTARFRLCLSARAGKVSRVRLVPKPRIWRLDEAGLAPASSSGLSPFLLADHLRGDQ